MATALIISYVILGATAIAVAPLSWRDDYDDTPPRIPEATRAWMRDRGAYPAGWRYAQAGAHTARHRSMA